jgi:hypothetical protein
VEKKVALDRSTTELTASTHPSSNLSKSTPSSLSYSAARKTHHSVLPPQLKFYGTTEYKDQYTNKGIIAEALAPSSPSPASPLPKKIVSTEEERKLTTKKLKEQSLTEHRSNFLWPSNYLYRQHATRPNHRSGNEAAPSSDTTEPLIQSPGSTTSVRSGSGVEEMKWIEERGDKQQSTQKSLIDADSIGSHVRELSKTQEDHSEGKKSLPHRDRIISSSELAKKWTPSQVATTDQLGETGASL